MSVLSATSVTSIPLSNIPSQGSSVAINSNQPSPELEKINRICTMVTQRKRVLCKMKCVLLVSSIFFTSGSVTVYSGFEDRDSVTSTVNSVGLALLIFSGITLCVSAYLGLRSCIIKRKIVTVYIQLRMLQHGTDYFSKFAPSQKDEFERNRSAVGTIHTV